MNRNIQASTWITRLTLLYLLIKVVIVLQVSSLRYATRFPFYLLIVFRLHVHLTNVLIRSVHGYVLLRLLPKSCPIAQVFNAETVCMYYKSSAT